MRPAVGPPPPGENPGKLLGKPERRMARIVYKDCGCEGADYGVWKCPEHGTTATLIETDFIDYGRTEDDRAEANPGRPLE